MVNVYKGYTFIINNDVIILIIMRSCNDPQCEITRPPWEKGQPWSHPAGLRGLPLGILPADGRLKSLVVYLTTPTLRNSRKVKENQPWWAIYQSRWQLYEPYEICNLNQGSRLPITEKRGLALAKPISSPSWKWRLWHTGWRYLITNLWMLE